MDHDENTQTRSATRPSDSIVGQTIVGKYRIGAKLGTGGMGSVYRATRLLIGDEVAIKILNPGNSDPNAVDRFQQEARAAARLKHPNAVVIHDFGTTEDGLQYLVMELVEGQTLRQVIKTQGPLAPTTAAEIIKQVCSALEEAHQHQIVHRDLKPDNIIVNTAKGGPRAKVLDFGIAKLRDLAVGHLTQTGSVMGTPHYMSPEQCLGEEIDHRSDIYSLGIVLYEMLTGIVPFNSPISTAVVVQHVNQKPPSLRTINVNISEELERVVFHALEKKREARPQTVTALATELESALSHTNVASSDISSSPVSAKGSDVTQVMTAPAAISSRDLPKTEGARISSKSNRTIQLAVLSGILVIVGAAIVLMARQNNEPRGPANTGNGQATATGPDRPPQASQPTNSISAEEARQFLESWRSSWERADLFTYASFYDESFVGRNYSAGKGFTSMTRAQWLKDKEQKFRRSSSLSIIIGEPEIQSQGDSVSLVFSQEFRSNSYADRGLKTLRLHKTSDGIKIVSEDFVPRGVSK
jgi:serine/threonine protein kinase